MRKQTSMMALAIMGAATLGACSADNVADDVATTRSAVWSGTPSDLPDELGYPASCRIDSTKWLVAGGVDDSGNAVKDTFLYDNGTWYTMTAAQELRTARSRAQMILLPGTDQCLIIAGVDGEADNSAALASAEIFDYSVYLNSGTRDGNGFQSTGSLNDARTAFAMTTCAGKVVVAGGQTTVKTSPSYVGSVEVFNGSTWSRFNSSTTLVTARSYLGAVCLAKPATDDFYLFVLGGETALAASSVVNRIEIDQDGAYVGIASMEPIGGTGTAVAVSKFAAFPIAADKILLTGGTQNKTSAVATTRIIDVDSDADGSWTTGTSLTTARVEPVVVKDESTGDYVVIGGKDDPDATLPEEITTSQRFDLDKMGGADFVTAVTMGQGRWAFAAASLSDGIYVAGGVYNNSTTKTFLTDVEKGD